MNKKRNLITTLLLLMTWFLLTDQVVAASSYEEQNFPEFTYTSDSETAEWYIEQIRSRGNRYSMSEEEKEFFSSWEWKYISIYEEKILCYDGIFLYYPVIAFDKSINDIIIMYTDEHGGLDISGDTDYKRFYRNIHIPHEVGSIESLCFNYDFCVTFNSKDGLIQVWQFWKCFSSFQSDKIANTEYCGYSENEGHIFHNTLTGEVVSVHGYEDEFRKLIHIEQFKVKHIASDIRYVINASFCLDPEMYYSQPLFLTNDNKIVVFDGTTLMELEDHSFYNHKYAHPH